MDELAQPEAFQCLIHLNLAAGREEARDVVALPATNDVIRRFDRDTEWLAKGILGAMVSAALVLAALIQEGHPKPVDQAKEERQTSSDAMVNANPGTLSKAMGLNAESSTGEITSGQATSVDHGFTSPHETPSQRMETASSTQTPVLALTPETNQPNLQANASPWSSAHRHDSARAIRPEIHNIRFRSSVRLRFVHVKMRPIALWHQSSARSQRPRSSTTRTKGERSKVSCTAETSH